MKSNICELTKIEICNQEWSGWPNIENDQVPGIIDYFSYLTCTVSHKMSNFYYHLHEVEYSVLKHKTLFTKCYRKELKFFFTTNMSHLV